MAEAEKRLGARIQLWWHAQVAVLPAAMRYFGCEEADYENLTSAQFYTCQSEGPAVAHTLKSDLMQSSGLAGRSAPLGSTSAPAQPSSATPRASAVAKESSAAAEEAPATAKTTSGAAKTTSAAAKATSATVKDTSAANKGTSVGLNRTSAAAQTTSAFATQSSALLEKGPSVGAQPLATASGPAGATATAAPSSSRSDWPPVSQIPLDILCFYTRRVAPPDSRAGAAAQPECPYRCILCSCKRHVQSIAVSDGEIRSDFAREFRQLPDGSM